MKKALNFFFDKFSDKKDSEQKSFNDFTFSNKFTNNSEVNINKFDAFGKNVIVYRAINLIASSVASVNLKLYRNIDDKKIEVHEHPLVDLLHRPNPLMGGADFFQNVIINKIITGNSFILAAPKGMPKELYILNSEKVTIEKGNNIFPKSYIYQAGDKKIKYIVDPFSGKSQILHLKNYNPYDELTGYSSLAAAHYSIAQHNEASKWNLSMLKNAARPSGALTLKSSGNEPSYLNKEQYNQLKEQLDELYTSSSNVGKPLLLQGGLDWKELSLSPKDMDFIEAKHSNARDIALCLGIPPQLLGIPGDSTYSNMQEARLSLWEETIIPTLDHLIDELNNWLIPMFNDQLIISYNLDSISALSVRHEKLWKRLESSNFLTINEKRKQVGLSPLEGGDKLWN